MRKAAIEIRLTRDEAKALSWVASTAIKLIEEDHEPSKHERIINGAVKRARKAVEKITVKMNEAAR
jgi:hypothetical protein